MSDDYGQSEEQDDDGPLPVVDGLTVTQPDTEPAHLRLAKFFAQRPGGSTGRAINAVTELEAAFQGEADPVLRARYAAARSILLNGPTTE